MGIACSYSSAPVQMHSLSNDVNGFCFRNDEHGLLVSCLLEAIYLHGYHEQGVKVCLEI